jgi:hypothetical protein
MTVTNLKSAFYSANGCLGRPLGWHNTATGMDPSPRSIDSLGQDLCSRCGEECLQFQSSHSRKTLTRPHRVSYEKRRGVMSATRGRNAQRPKYRQTEEKEKESVAWQAIREASKKTYRVNLMDPPNGPLGGDRLRDTRGFSLSVLYSTNLSRIMEADVRARSRSLGGWYDGPNALSPVPNRGPPSTRLPQRSSANPCFQASCHSILNSTLPCFVKAMFPRGRTQHLWSCQRSLPHSMSCHLTEKRCFPHAALPADRNISWDIR